MQTELSKNWLSEITCSSQSLRVSDSFRLSEIGMPVVAYAIVHVER
jgi:hypothetical protein